MSTTTEASDAELIDLEPTRAFHAVGSDAEGTPLDVARGDGVALVAGSVAGLSRETDTLRRRRLAAVALMLMVAYFALFAWTLAGAAASQATVWSLVGLRWIFAAAVLGATLSRLGASAKAVKALEASLFVGLVLVLVLTQYYVNLTLLKEGLAAESLAFMKNGVIQMIILMFCYGMMLPNPPRVVARAVLGMILAPLLAFAVLTEHEGVAEEIDKLRSFQQSGSNTLFLLIGGGMAIFGSAVLNGLRTQLHEARKFGQYRLIRRIGAGGMGEVHLAEHALLKRPCALKLIRPDSGADPLALARFEREVQSSARLAHHNTIEIYDYGHTDDGTFYYVMEYLDGMSLEDLVARYGPIPAARAVHLFRQVCAGLAEAHGLGLVHRDLKPANVFVAKQGGETDVAKVLDFGLVKVAKEPGAVALTADMTVSGTPLFMAPEQATSEKSLDHRADIYALGAVMYHALTGRPPFQGETAFAVMMAHVRDDVVPPSRIRPEVPADLEAVVLRCLAKKPEDRFVVVKELSAALAACSAAGGWGPDEADRWWATVDRHAAEAASAS